MDFNVNEIFHSIQGEGSRMGEQFVFVRFQGCLLRCVWCDTPYALERKEIATIMSIELLIEKISSYECKNIMLTGGEPLEQKNIGTFITKLLDFNYNVVIETNGQQDISKIDKRAVLIMDLKCPDSLMMKKNRYDNIEFLKSTDEVKFVINSRKDFDWSVEQSTKFNLFEKVSNVLFSPVFDNVPGIELANWILASKLPIRMQLQLHKYIWEPMTRGV